MKKEANIDDYYLNKKVQDETLAQRNRDHIRSMPQWFPLVTIRYPHGFVKDYICYFAQDLGISSDNTTIMMHYSKHKRKPPAIYLCTNP